MNADVCLLTPPGKAALAVLGVRGADAAVLARAVFHRRKDALPETLTPGDSFVGWLGDARTGGADEAMLLVAADSLEFHCHGGTHIVELLLDHMQSLGARRVPSSSWPCDSAARTALMHAPTLRTAGIALDQLRGVPRTDRFSELIEVGRHLVRPWKVVLAGAPNVGKSSLINALVGFTRSVVAATPGTTRDVVATTIALDGWPIELSDTAGLRADAASLERAGIERARQAVAEADLCLWILDGASIPAWPDFDIPRMLLVINKIDLPAGWPHHNVISATRVSAHTGEGLLQLSDAISLALVPSPPVPGEAVPLP